MPSLITHHVLVEQRRGVGGWATGWRPEGQQGSRQDERSKKSSSHRYLLRNGSRVRAARANVCAWRLEVEGRTDVGRRSGRTSASARRRTARAAEVAQIQLRFRSPKR